MTTSSKIYLLSFTIIFFFISICVKAKEESFIINIIHRDSPKSPLFDNTTTPIQRIHNALLRSDKRMNYLFPNKASTINDDDPRPTLVGQDGEYIMEYSLGNPMFETYGVIDTGSDFTWLQCLPCIRCFNQGDLDYLHTDFNVGLHAVDCTSPLCIQIVNPSVTEVLCDADNCQCKYMMEYSDGSTSAGNVFHTLLRLQTTPGNYVGFPRFIFGCSRETTGDFSTIASGIIGLGRAPASMISQIYDYIDGKFAYCLVPMGQDAVSEMRFGQIAVISGPGIIYTPMIPQILTSDNYHILMEGITVGDVYVPYLEGDTIANTVIDCGTTVTRLPERFYSFLEGQVARQLDRLYRRSSDPGGYFNLCYKNINVERIQSPSFKIHLTGGVLELRAENIFTMIGNKLCFCFKPYPGDKAVLGTILQANFMVSFDLERKKIGFKKMNCAFLN